MRNENPEYYAILYKDDEPIEFHVFTAEPTAKHNRYRAVSSMGWFSEREVALRYGDNPKKNLSPFHMSSMGRKAAYDKEEASWLAQCKKEGREAEYKELYANIPHFEHTSLWDMYAAVGYDYKKKKWIRETQPKGNAQ